VSRTCPEQDILTALASTAGQLERQLWVTLLDEAVASSRWPRTLASSSVKFRADIVSGAPPPRSAESQKGC
jgi:hypothetical protein